MASSISSPERTRLTYTTQIIPSDFDLQESSSASFPPPRTSQSSGSSGNYQYRISKQTFHEFVEKTEFIPHQPAHFSALKLNVLQLFHNWREQTALPHMKFVLSCGIAGIIQNHPELEEERQEFIAHLAEFMNYNKPALLFIAAKENYFSLIPMILTHGRIDINTLDEFHNTALHEAILQGHRRSIQLLLDHGALTDIKNFEGKTAKDYLRASEFQDLFREYFLNGSALL